VTPPGEGEQTSFARHSRPLFRQRDQQAMSFAFDLLSYQDVELAGMVVADDDRIDGRYLEVHQGILSLLARQAPVASDLRIVAALLHVIRCIERMGDQCVNIAKLVPLSGYESPKDKDILDSIERMGQLARSQVSQAREALRSRNVERRKEALEALENLAAVASHLKHLLLVRDLRRIAK